MNRPYYALASLLAVLCGSAVALGPVHSSSATANAAAASRSLCGTGPRNVLIAASLLAQFEAGWEAGSSEQGSDDNVAYGYDDSCGYDPCRGEIYDAEVPAPEKTAKVDEGTFAEECETWPSDERVDQAYLEFERCIEPQTVDFAELDCIRANDEWLQKQAAEEVNDWKTATVQTPDWICEYLYGCPNHEAQYAAAEEQAARDAQEYGPSLPATQPDLAAYGNSYQSLYDLDAILANNRDEDEDEYPRASRGAAAGTIGRFFKKLYQLFDEVLPKVSDDADEWMDSADDAWQQLEEISTQLLESAPEKVTADELDAPWFSHHQQVVELPAEAADSRKLLESVADSLRWTGQALLIAADEIEAEAERVLSARHEPGFSR